MSVITEEIAARLRRSGYDATHGSWDAIEGVSEATDFVVVNGITVIGWRYPDGDWLWDDRAAYLVDKGLDPLRRFTQPPYFDRSHRWEWLPSQPNAPEEHPVDTASAAELGVWIIKRLPAPNNPNTILFRHPSDVGRYADLAPQVRSLPRPSSWPWTSDWEASWANADGQAGR